MKKSNFFILSLICTLAFNCNSGPQKEKNISDTELYNILNLINDKDSLSLKKIINEDVVNLFDSAGVNVMTHAVMTGDINLVKIIGEKGADLNVKNKTKTGSTPLMMASEYKSLEIANYLLDMGADVNIQDNNGDPAIHWSAYFGNVPFTKLMLDKGALSNLKSIHSDGVMQVALKEWQDSIVDFLLENNITVYDVKPEANKIISAVKNNDLRLFKSQLNKDNLNERDGAGNTLLMIASQKGYEDMVKSLVAAGADIDALNPAGHTALNLATYYGKNSVAKFLISKSADVNKTDDRFILSPLVAAIRGNNLEIGKMLLNKNADVNTLDGINNFSPIMWAALNQNKDFVTLLLTYHPDLSIVSKYNTTVYDMTDDKDIIGALPQK